MKYNLIDICEIQSGVHIKSSNLCDKGKKAYLNIKDFDRGELSLKNISYAKIDINPKFFITTEDVLLSTRIKFNAYIVPEQSDKNFIASTSFAILKPKKNKVLRDYLLWYFNHPKTIKQLEKFSPSQSKMLYVSLSKLKELKIDLPSLEKQKEIVHINSLHQKEKEITLKIKSLKEQYIQTILLKSTEL